MKNRLLQSLILYGMLTYLFPAAASAGEFNFGVISPPLRAETDITRLDEAIEESNADNLAFVVANGIKAVDEPCTDSAYNRRKELLQSAKNGLIVSLAASDWSECKGESGKPAAIGKLNRLRELFFIDEFSLGASRIPLIRQSTTAKFRNFPENARWEIGDIMFATINLPANNNHYVLDAGRNGEFEDRLIANRDWLHRIFTTAARRKMDGIVLFCDGNPLLRATGGKRDDFAETRRQIVMLAARFPGKVLLVHGRTTGQSVAPAIMWRGNLGELATVPGWIKISINASASTLFTVATKEPHAKK